MQRLVSVIDVGTVFHQKVRYLYPAPKGGPMQRCPSHIHH